MFCRYREVYMKDLVVAGQKFLHIFLQSCMLTAKQYCAYIAVCEFLDLKNLCMDGYTYSQL